jgi:hypothetical protein
VLPFNNLSGDPEQELFADGMTEDVIAALSRLRWFLVIARNSTFVYKHKAVNIKQIARPRRGLCPRRERAEVRQPNPSRGAIDRREQRRSPLGSKL